jgi:hypothetical protein
VGPKASLDAFEQETSPFILPGIEPRLSFRLARNQVPILTELSHFTLTLYLIGPMDKDSFTLRRSQSLSCSVHCLPLIGGLISLWLYKETTSYGIENIYLLYIFPPPPDFHTLMASLF